MKNTKYGIVDNETGEYIGDYKPKKKKPKSVYFLTFYDNTIKYDLVITPLIQALFGEMDTENILSLSAKTRKLISDKLKVDTHTVNCAITRLQKRHIILKLSPSVYFVNPYLFSKSNREKMNDLQLKFNQLVSEVISKENKPKTKKKDPEINIIKLPVNGRTT